jgi:hypothetical protein
MTFQFVRPIESPSEVAEYRAIIHQAIGGCVNSKDDRLWLVKRKGWTAAIAYDGYFYEEESEARLIQTLLDFGYQEFIAISWSKVRLSPPVLVLPTSIDSIEEVRLNTFHWYVFFAGQPDWFILLAQSLDLVIVAGQHEFVCQVLGGEPDKAEACLDFRSMAENHVSLDLRRYYTHLLKQIEMIYPQAQPGEVVNLGLLDWETAN